MDRMSYRHQLATRPLVYQTLPSLLQRRAQCVPDKEAYVFRRPGEDRDVITFRHLNERSARVAAGLLGLGVSPGDRVALLGAACPEMLYACFGAQSLKAVVVFISPDAVTSDSLNATLTGLKCTALIYHPGPREKLHQKLTKTCGELFASDDHSPREGALSSIIVLPAIQLNGQEVTSVRHLADTECTAAQERCVRDLTMTLLPDDMAVVFMTSGTTGLRKGVAHSHMTVIDAHMKIRRYHDWLYPGEKDAEGRYFNDRSFAWIAGMFCLPLVLQITGIHVDPEFVSHATHLDFMYRIMAEEAVTAALLLPYWFPDLISGRESGRKCLPDTLRLVMTGGEQLNKSLTEQLHILPKMMNGYGSSEAGLILLERVSEQLESGLDATFSETFEGLEVKIADEHGCCVAIGDAGELCIRGPGLFQGYIDLVSGQLESGKSPSGWFKTGDMACFLPDGKIQLLGRKAEVISRGIRKLYPSGMENILAACPKVHQCVVVAVPDERMYEEVCACVVPVAGETLTEEEVIEFFAQHLLVSTEMTVTPRYVWILEEMPLNKNGKIDRKQVRVNACEKYSPAKN